MLNCVWILSDIYDDIFKGTGDKTFIVNEGIYFRSDNGPHKFYSQIWSVRKEEYQSTYRICCEIMNAGNGIFGIGFFVDISNPPQLWGNYSGPFQTFDEALDSIEDKKILH